MAMASRFHHEEHEEHEEHEGLKLLVSFSPRV
jgi:hypothetical protein